MRHYRHSSGARFGFGVGLAVFAFTCASSLEALQSSAVGQTCGQSTAGISAPVASIAASATSASGADPVWWRLVEAHIDGPIQAGADSQPNSDLHPVNLMIPAGWKLKGRVDWPLHKGAPSLTFHVDSPDGQIGLDYLPHESWNWSEDAATRAKLQAIGQTVQRLPATRAGDYLRTVLLPELRSGAQVIAIEPLPTVTDYLNQELSGTNMGDKIGAEQTGTAVPMSSGDAARARITYMRNGAPVEEWIEIAVEHLQRHADNTPPWRPGETSRLAVAHSGPLINTFKIVECDIMRAPQGTLERNSRILRTILSHMIQNGSWTTQVSYEYWHGKFDDEIIYFRSSYFGEDRFNFDDPSSRESYSFAYDHAWKNDSSNEFIVTDSAAFDPNGRTGAQSWTRLRLHIDQ